MTLEARRFAYSQYPWKGQAEAEMVRVFHFSAL